MKNAQMFQTLFSVSMPHAALWVVQLEEWVNVVEDQYCFNAARGFVGGATLQPEYS